MHEDKKFCPDCDRMLERSEFHRNKRRKDGLAAYCKRCSKVRRYGTLETTVHRSTQKLLARIASDRKFCRRCGQEKSLSQDFHYNRCAPDGHAAYCKVCHGEDVKRTRSPDRVRAYAQKYRDRNKERHA